MESFYLCVCVCVCVCVNFNIWKADVYLSNTIRHVVGNPIITCKGETLNNATTDFIFLKINVVLKPSFHLMKHDSSKCKLCMTKD